MSVTTNNMLFASGLKKSFKIGRNKLDVLKDVEINIKTNITIKGFCLNISIISSLQFRFNKNGTRLKITS